MGFFAAPFKTAHFGFETVNLSSIELSLAFEIISFRGYTSVFFKKLIQLFLLIWNCNPHLQQFFPGHKPPDLVHVFHRTGFQ